MKENDKAETKPGLPPVTLDEIVRSNSDIFIDIPSVGFGTHRSSGTWMLLMLMAEDKPYRENIIADLMTRLDITPERIRKVMDDKACPKCGISLLAHEDNDGRCF